MGSRKSSTVAFISEWDWSIAEKPDCATFDQLACIDEDLSVGL